MKAEIARRILLETPWLTTATTNALEAELAQLERLATEYQSPETQVDLELAKAVKTVFEFLDEEASVEGVNSDGFWRFDSIGELLDWYRK